MKKLFGVMLSISIAVSLCVPGLAATPTESVNLIENIAYMNIAEASSELRQQILQERERIIFSESWVSDEVNGRILDKDGNVKEELPHFSDLFPEDWDVPAMMIPNGEAEPMQGITFAVETNEEFDWNPVFDKSVLLKKPPENTGSPAFYSLSTTGFEGTPYIYYIETVRTCGIYMNPAEEANYNCGYSNKNTGKSYGYKVGLENGESFEIDPPKGIELSIRASTYTNVGNWSMIVYAKRVWPD